MKRLLRYAAGMGVGAAAGMVIAKRVGPPAFGDKPRRRPAVASTRSMPGRLGGMWKRAVDEGRRVMKQTEEELAKQVASTSDGLP